MKHAYLIIAHNNFDILQTLISMLDDETNDIFVHVDKKSGRIKKVPGNKSRVIFLSERVDVRWGHLSQIKTEMLLMKAAVAVGEYSHYFIISGQHLPLVGIDVINEYADAHAGKSIFKLWQEDAGDVSFKFGRYHFFTKGCYSSNAIVARVSNVLWRLFLKVQSWMGIQRRFGCLVKADQWCVLSNEAVSQLLRKEKYIMTKYRYTFCPDEYVIASEITRIGLPYVDCQKFLHTEFVGPSPKSFHVSELDSLKTTGAFFARKFIA